jgi:outer membrane protein OmpA-like peptidoglycan-associated protein
MWWLRWGLPVAAGVIVLIVLVARANNRFERAVAALNEEPGLVVLNAQRVWRTWDISGLRDPQARPPQVVLAAAGLTPRSLRGRWEPYLSLDSGVVLSRARQVWSLPPSTRLSLRADTLVVGGELPLAALGMMRLANPPAGIAAVALDAPELTLPPHLDAARATMVADRVLFAPGASVSSAGERVRAQSLANRFRAFEDSVSAYGGEIELKMIGRTDPSGTNETNQALAQWRVDHVSAIFASAGVRAERVRGEALATSRPLPAPDSAEQARINRSVSFEIGVSARPRVPRER